jgi:peptide/nickel transport system permease protein
MAGEEKDPQVIEQIRKQYHLDEPLPMQYGRWMAGVLQGDLGESMRIKQPVAQLVAEKLPVTLQLATMAMLIALLIGIPAGILSAVKKGSAWDVGANVFALWGLSTPNFWLGIMLIFLFSVKLGWLPASGFVSPREDLMQSLATTIMPAFVLGTGVASVLMRHTRAAMLGALEQDYIRTARAKGVVERSVIARHALRNALIPVVTLGTIEFGRLLAGAVLTELQAQLKAAGGLALSALRTATLARNQCEELLEVYKGVVPEYVVRGGGAAVARRGGGVGGVSARRGG